MNPMTENSVAQALADAIGATVYAYLRRTSYYDTLLNNDERDFIDAVHFYIRRDKNKREYKGYTEFKENPVLSNKQLERFNFLDAIWNGNKYLIDGEILYPEGARYPVTYDDTPRGLDANMKIFWKIK